MQTNCTLSEFRNKHQWLEQPNPPEDTALYKRAAIKYLKHINYKSGDKLLIGDTTREVIPLIALESKKWKTVNPNFVTLD